MRRWLLRAFAPGLVLLIWACAPDAAAPTLVSAPMQEGVAAPAMVAAAPSVAVAASAAAPLRPTNASAHPLVPAAVAPAPTMTANSQPAPKTAAQEVLVLDDASGAVLYQVGGDTKAAPASLTKIVTAVVAIQQGHLDDWVTVDVDSRTMYDSTVMGLRPGDRFTLRDLLYGLMLPSGNDAALAIARAVSGSDAAFVTQMNDLMSSLGLDESHFQNPHGLADADHYTSARDLALVSRYAMTLPLFREIVDTVTHVAVGSRTIVLNSLISGMLTQVPGVDGVKSGFTEQAGRTIVVSEERNGHRLYAVVLNDEQREIDAANLLQWAFTTFTWGPPMTNATVARLDTPSPTPGPTGDDQVVHAAGVGR